MSRSIITPYEVVKYGPNREDYPISAVERHIARVEREAFKSCFLGEDLRASLMKDLNKVTGDPYNPNTTYNIGEIVAYRSYYLISLKDANTTHIEEDSDADPSWGFPPKFTTEAHNDLWEYVMSDWLAFAVVGASMEYSTYQIGSRGASKVYSDTTGIGTVSHQDFAMLKRKIMADTQKLLGDMFDYMKQVQGVNPVFDSQGLKDECSKIRECGRPRQGRRFYFSSDNY